MRADAQALVDRIDAALNLVKMSLDWDRALRRLDELNARVEDPKLWDQPKKAEEVMRERRRLDAAIGTVREIGSDKDGTVELIKLAEMESDAALAMSIDYVNTRQQFGKALGKFQAVQQVLAIFATEAAAAAAAALDRAQGDADAALFEIAAAKLRTNQAIGQATSIAHQVHGAIGFTKNYDLHLLTGPLLNWRSEYGNDAYWADVLGGMAARLGGAGLWAEVTRRAD